MEPSTRLVQVLATYCHGMRGTEIAELRYQLRRGRYPWLLDELGAAVFTTDVWQRVAGTRPRPGETAGGAAGREIQQLQRLLVHG